MDKRLTGPELVKYLRQFPSSDDRGWAADEIESLTDIIKRQAEQNEAAHAEIQEQARLLGGGAERELRLLAERDALREALDELANGYAGNRWDIGLVQRLKKARAALAQEQGGSDA